MQDMFSEGSINHCPDLINEHLPEKYKWYDLSHIAKNDFCGDFFGINTWLTKHTLLYKIRGARISMYSEHACVNANIADINYLLLHYKFDSEFINRATFAG